MAPPLEELSYEEVMKVYRLESKSASLTEVRRDFYAEVKGLVEKFKHDHEKELAADPYSTKARNLMSQINKITEKAMQIFDFRAEKVLLTAIRGASGAKVDTSRMVEEERQLFENVLQQVKARREGVLVSGMAKDLGFQKMSQVDMPLPAPMVENNAASNFAAVEEAKPLQATSQRIEEVLEKVSASEKPSLPIKEEKREPRSAPIQQTMDPDAKAAGIERSGIAPPDTAVPTQSKGGTEDLILRVLEDIPPFQGPGGTLKLGKEDIVTLPAAIGKALVKRGKAVEINPTV